MALKNGVRPVLVLTKTDLEQADEFARIYRAAGFEVIDLRGGGDALGTLRQRAAGKLSVFSGNSGVGKSTLLNELCPGLALETGETSKKLGRGRHTTRAVELFPFEGGYIADTPGFSSFEFEDSSPLRSSEVELGFPEFAPYLGQCCFTGCSHTVEKGCAVLQALRAGRIEPTRHESYVGLYKRAKEQENRY